MLPELVARKSDSHCACTVAVDALTTALSTFSLFLVLARRRNHFLGGGAAVYSVAGEGWEGGDEGGEHEQAKHPTAPGRSSRPGQSGHGTGLQVTQSGTTRNVDDVQTGDA